MTETGRILYVGIAGKKRHGKDTFAAYLRERLVLEPDPPWVLRRGFADAIRDEVATFLCRELAVSPNWPQEQDARMQQIMRCLNSSVAEEKEPFRPLMQWWGVEFRRRLFGDQYWIGALERFAQNCRQSLPEAQNLIVLIPDVRLRNEIDFIRDRGGLVVKVFRPNLEDGDAHVTETALDDFDAWDSLIVNDGSLSLLQHYAHCFFSFHLACRL